MKTFKTISHALVCAFIVSTTYLQAQTPTEVADTQFSVDRGIYTAPFLLEITSETPDALVVYTTDGSIPTQSNGRIYTTPINITTTTVIRAFAFNGTLAPTNVDTQTYIFPEDVVNQPADIAGYPRNNYDIGRGSDTRQMDYEMDPDITDDPAFSGSLLEGLSQIPTLSIVGDPAEIYGSNGYYETSNERVVSVETLYPDDPESNESATAGIESHSHDRLKRSLRLNFRSEYGDAKWDTDLFRKGDFQETRAEDKQDRVILRAGNNRSWARNWAEEKVTYVIDEFARQTQLAMGEDGSHGQFVHLYINGLYWGLYNPVERPDTFHNESYYGGEASGWFAVHHGGDISGDDSRYDYLRGTLKNKDLSVDANYEEFKEYLDVVNFIDYLLGHWYTNTSDWPHNNWHAANRNAITGAESFAPTPMKFFTWDGEWSWDLPRNGGTNFNAEVDPNFEAGRNKNQGSTIPQLFNSAKDNEDFRKLLADRAYKHLANNGALTDVNARTRFSSLSGAIDKAIVAESARWGDTLDANDPYDLNDWNNAVSVIDNLMIGRAAQLIQSLRAEGYYPSIDPPILSVRGGVVAPGSSVTLTNPNTAGDVYYTLDGTDPCDGGAILYTGPIVITDETFIHTRALVNGEWSAIDDASLVVAQIRISEINYHPADPTAAEIAAGFDDDDFFEFIEVTNTGTASVDMSNYTFDDGVTFTFPVGTVLAPGHRVLIVANEVAFAMRYPDAVDLVIGEFSSGRLDNGGERLQIESPLGQNIVEFTYDDAWYPLTDGAGYSLELIGDGTGDLDDISAWMISALPGGSPGNASYFYDVWAAQNLAAADRGKFIDPDGDGYSNLLEYATLQDPTDPHCANPITFNINSAGELEAEYTLSTEREDVEIALEVSHNLSSWGVLPSVVDSEVQELRNMKGTLAPSGERAFLRLNVQEK